MDGDKLEANMKNVFSAPPVGGRRPTVLLVEEDEGTRRAMTACLTGRGFTVLATATGQEAARSLDQPPEPIDAAVVDLGLPDINGVALCEVMHEFHPFLPVVVCSGRATPEDVRRVRQAGVRRYLRKPVDPEELVAAVEESVL
jgi:DNA-binding response OmpR family regulator